MFHDDSTIMKINFYKSIKAVQYNNTCNNTYCLLDMAYVVVHMADMADMAPDLLDTVDNRFAVDIRFVVENQPLAVASETYLLHIRVHLELVELYVLFG